MRPVALALLLAACPPEKEADTADSADSAEDSGSDTGETVAFGPGRAEAACSPDDGAAVEIQLGLADATCEATMGTGPFLRLVVWNHGAPLDPGAYPLTASDDGMATYDPDGAGSTDAASATGSVTIVSWATGSIVGSYSVDLPDGTRLAGEFDVPWCESDVMCG